MAFGPGIHWNDRAGVVEVEGLGTTPGIHAPTNRSESTGVLDRWTAKPGLSVFVISVAMKANPTNHRIPAASQENEQAGIEKLGLSYGQERVLE